MPSSAPIERRKISDNILPMTNYNNKRIVSILLSIIVIYIAYKIGISISSERLTFHLAVIMVMLLISLFCILRYPELILAMIFLISEGALNFLLGVRDSAKYSLGPIKLTPLDLFFALCFSYYGMMFRKFQFGGGFLKKYGIFGVISTMMFLFGLFAAFLSVSRFVVFPVGWVNAFGIHRFFFYYVLFFPALFFLEHRHRLDRFLKIALIIIIILALETSFTQFTGKAIFNPITLLDFSERDFIRIYSSYEESIAVLILFGMLWLLRAKRYKVMVYLIILVGSLSLFWSMGRTLWFTTGLAATIALFLYTRRYKINVGNIFLGTFLLIFTISLSLLIAPEKYEGFQDILTRRTLTGVTDFLEKGGTFGLRLERVQWHLIEQHPWLGIGPWSQEAFIFDFTDNWENPYRSTGHMGYGDILLRHGIVGLMVFTTLWLGYIYRAFYIQRRTKTPVYYSLICVFIAINLVRFIGLLTGNDPLNESATITMVLMMAITEAIFKIESSSLTLRRGIKEGIHVRCKE